MFPHVPDFKGTLVVRHPQKNNEIARGCADIERSDVRDAGQGDGFQGFHVQLPHGWEGGQDLTPNGIEIVVEELSLVLNDVFNFHKEKVSPKFWHNINQLCILEPGEGVWLDEENEWAWISNKAEFFLTAKVEGTMTFCLLMPEEDMHKQTQPMKVVVKADSNLIFEDIINGPGHHEIKANVIKNHKVTFDVTCDKFVIPNEYCGNKDKRKLSLIVTHFGVI